ncbi:glycosyltransferase family 4 protein [Halomonas sp. M20]|uniref:glycosyltransferase family 4 protein n=1 Tax=Halomonas sp. M20 TaxID=2763264 RepID=UPI001D09A6E4|nr:glycosyltransferase family 4 protein [Halomonas sp. M20]
MPSPTLSHPLPLAVIAIRQIAKSTGASRNAFEQAAALKELGYRVVILAERGKPALTKQTGAEFIRLRRWPFKGPFRRFWFNRRVQSWCKRHRPALLVSHGDAESRDVIYMHNCVHLASQRIHGKALPKGHEVAAIHDHVLSQGRFQRIAVNSRMMADDFKRRYGLADHQLEVSYPGYDPVQFTPIKARAERDTFRETLGVGQHEFLIGLITSGNFKKRNVAGFVEIAGLLSQRLPNQCRFLVIGKDDATPYRQQAEKLGISDRFIWHSTVSDVEHFYGALDVFTLPAHIEEFGRVALEAMACGTPVLLSTWVGAAELIEKEFPDLILENNSNAWALRIAELLANDEQEELGPRLAELATHYSHQEQYKKLKASFQSLADGS